MFVVDLTYRVPLDEVDVHLEAHRRFLAEQYAAGVFVASGPKVPRTGGVILARSDSPEHLAAVLARDPFHVHGVAAYRVTEFHVKAAALGLEHLMDA
ncbi:MAG: YciI family protein [Bacteroidota bacterium]